MALIEVLEFDAAEQVVEEGQDGLELLSLPRTEMLEREVPTYEMLELAEQGPPGPPGPQGVQGVPGPQGEGGGGITYLGALPDASLLPGTGAPGDAFSIGGRLHMRTTAGEWVDAGPVGAPGKDGQIRFTGTGEPPVLIVGASPGDTYLDTETGHIYTLN